MGRRAWGWFLAGIVAVFLGLMAWSLYRADRGTSPIAEEYLRERP